MRQAHNIQTVLILIIMFGLVVFSFNPFISRDEPLLLYDIKRLFVIVVIGFALTCNLANNQLKSTTYNSWFTLERESKYVLITIIASSIISTLIAKYPLGAATQWAYILGLIMMTFILKPIAFLERKRIWQYYCWISVLLFFSVAFGFWIRVSHGLNASQFTILSFANPRFLNQVHVWLIIPIAYLCVLQLKHNQRAELLRLVMAMSFAVIMATNARGITISITGAFLILILFDMPHRKLWLRLFWQSVFFGIIISLVFLHPLPSILLDLKGDLEPIDTGSAGRIDLWLETIGMIQFWGLGGEAFVCDSVKFGRPHNSVLNIMVHWGVIPAIGFCILCAKCFIDTLKSKHTRTKVAGVTLLSGLAYSLVSGTLSSPLSQLLAVLSCAIYWGSTATKLDIKKSIPKGFVVIFSLVTMVFIFASGYRVYDRFSHYPEYQEMVKTQFWIGFNCIAHPDKT
ncbi:O-antigen ligase domain-containing protein [Vibrio astriarenae]|uniref:O-antigen ligase domain-containing protein n=1 Tax=Vibrio astriarenae TaxID=1481923 RepID=A0A7Z2T480_9VIBR|nr:O-antigen ligase family protein [Vibrio astriarenae]QIA64064.1 O-antigen ligase domain-containing protein [Vibrio astriarenae]